VTTATTELIEGKTPDQIIAAYHKWLFKTASQMMPADSPDLEDLVQEGRIAMWLALKSYTRDKGSLPAWLTLKAKYRMIEIVKGKRATGAPSRLHGRNPATELQRTTLSLDAERGDGVTLADLISVDPIALDAAELAYHQDEIARAIMELPDAQRRYVIARFFEAMTGREMQEAGVFNYEPSALWTSQKNGARKKLAAALAHLDQVA